MIHSADLPLLDHLLREGEGGESPVVEANHVLDARLLHRRRYFLRLLEVHRHRFFQEDVLPSFCGGDRHLGMGAVGGVYVDKLHVLPVDELFP